MDIPKKISKPNADYRRAETERVRCGTCTMFREPDSCTLVEGSIAEDAVCAFWEPKPRG